MCLFVELLKESNGLLLYLRTSLTSWTGSGSSHRHSCWLGYRQTGVPGRRIDGTLRYSGRYLLSDRVRVFGESMWFCWRQWSVSLRRTYDHTKDKWVFLSRFGSTKGKSLSKSPYHLLWMSQTCNSTSLIIYKVSVTVIIDSVIEAPL